MIWRWLVASILGFLAVVPLARLSPLPNFTLPTNPHSWLMVTLIYCAIIALNGLIGYGLKRRKINQNEGSHSRFFAPILPVIFSGINCIGVLLASSSYGLYQYFNYQNTLVTEPVTITATVRSLQISDNITLSDTTNAVKSDKSLALIGSGYQRQVWQIVDIKPFAGDKSSENSDNEAVVNQGVNQGLAENFTQKLPLNVLATANLNKNPDWLPILNNLQPNQTLTVKLALEPIIQPKEIDNPNFEQISLGFNEALWLRQRDIQAKAQVIAISPKTPSHDLAKTSDNFLQKIQLSAEQIRWQLRQKMLNFLQSHSPSSPDQVANFMQSTGILLSLLTGDSGLVTTDTKHLYQVTGISHLLAISGPHVMMLASVVAFLLVAMVKLFFPKLLFRLPAQLLLLWVSVAVSFMYALLVGFELPAQRTVWMLLLVTMSVQWLLPISGFWVLAWVGLLMVWLDTTAVMQAGFWLSFVAVGLLLKFSQNFATPTALTDSTGLFQDTLTKIWQSFKQLLLLQLWLFVLMLPVVVWFFGKISLVSIAVNLVAVPFLGLVVVPLDMLAGVLSFVPVIGKILSENLWQFLTFLLTIFHAFLQKISDIGFAKQAYMGLSNPQLILCGVSILIAFSPKRLVPKLFALPLLLAVFAIGYQANTIPQPPKLVVLDDTRLSVNLWVNGDDSWLILADNRFVKTDKNPTEAKISPSGKFETDILENKLYPLLAKYHVDRLAGVVSQTPSQNANALVQQLAKNVPVKQYWLAGFNASVSNVDLKFDKITPQACIVGKTSQQSDVQAVTGWLLDEGQLGKPLDDKEKWQTQTCFIRVQSPQKSAIIMAGDSDVPMQMSQLLCQISPADVLISPTVTPINQDWLATTKPKQIHLITSRYSTPSEDSQFAIAGYLEDVNNENIEKNNEKNSPQKAEFIQSSEVGTVAYRFE